MTNKLISAERLTSENTVIFPDPSSLGYAIQGSSIVKRFLSTTTANLLIQTDPRLVSLFERSFNDKRVRLIPKESGPALPNNGKPRTAEEMELYFSQNAEEIAKAVGCNTYTWSTLLRPEIAHPFNAHTPPDEFIPSPSPNYLCADPAEINAWQSQKNGAVPILINWNKGFSQHGDAAQQNLDANDVAFIIAGISKRSNIKLDFMNAVHGITGTDLQLINSQLPENIQLRNIVDPMTEKNFNLGAELDRYMALMSACKNNHGLMIGVGNTYQHMWYAAQSNSKNQNMNQIVVLPYGDFPTKATWELQARQPNSPTLAMSKTEGFHISREQTLQQVINNACKMLDQHPGSHVPSPGQ